ncbi:hypothetical protein AN219_19595 [Streptomyces nanshensis]|nr:hypothetical protein AN219_19595 [Streptomyces nanshensis]
MRNGSEAPGAVEDGSAWTVAHVERALPPGGAEEYRKARKDGTREFDLWADPYRAQRVARVVTQPGGGRVAAYEVFGGPAGEQLALITRQKAFTRGRIRARWSVQQTGQRAATGVKGRVFWHCVWWLLLPFWVFIAFGSPDVPRIPVRTRFRREGQRALDWRSDGLDVPSDGWDPRVLAALVALMSSHAGFVKDSWDDYRV